MPEPPSRTKAWASLSAREDDIVRIANDGLDGSERDSLIAQQACCVVWAELIYLRRITEGN